MKQELLQYNSPIKKVLESSKENIRERIIEIINENEEDSKEQFLLVSIDKFFKMGLENFTEISLKRDDFEIEKISECNYKSVFIVFISLLEDQWNVLIERLFTLLEYDSYIYFFDLMGDYQIFSGKNENFEINPSVNNKENDEYFKNLKHILGHARRFFSNLRKNEIIGDVFSKSIVFPSSTFKQIPFFKYNEPIDLTNISTEIPRGNYSFDESSNLSTDLEYNFFKSFFATHDKIDKVELKNKLVMHSLKKIKNPCDDKNLFNELFKLNIRYLTDLKLISNGWKLPHINIDTFTQLSNRINTLIKYANLDANINFISAIRWRFIDETWDKDYPIYIHDSSNTGVDNIIKDYSEFVLFKLLQDEFLKEFSTSDLLYRELPEKFPLVIKKKAKVECEFDYKILLNEDFSVKEIEIFIQDSEREAKEEEFYNNCISNIRNSIKNLSSGDRYIKNLDSWYQFDSRLLENKDFTDGLITLERDINQIIKLEMNYKKSTNKKSTNNDVVNRIRGFFETLFIISGKDYKFSSIEYYSQSFRKLLQLYKLVSYKKVIHLPIRTFIDTVWDSDQEYLIDMASGGFMFYSNQDFELDYDVIKTFGKLLFRSDAIHGWVEKRKADVIKESMKSAIASIMSRNMSHNLGSHVLSGLKYKIKSTFDETSDIFNETLLDFCKNYDTKVLNESYQNGIAWLLNYLQERQDYIATISGFENRVYVPVNFKEFIFDGLLPDKKHERHEKFPSHTNILLEEIARSEDYERDEIVIKFGKFDGSNFNRNEDSEELKSYKVLSKLQVALPAGIMGRQAFYSIVENFIRNTAKHNPKKDRIEIIIDTPNEYKNYDGDFDDEKILFTISDNMHNYEASASTIQQALEDNLVDNQGQLRHFYKGIKEMKISAAWLRGITSEDWYKLQIMPLQLSTDPEEIEGPSISFKFYLLRSKEVLIVLSNELFDNFKSEHKETIVKLQRFGINIISEIERKENKWFRHNLNYIDSNVSETNKQYFIQNLNQRVVFDDFRQTFRELEDLFSQVSYNDINEAVVDSILYMLWGKWLEQQFVTFEKHTIFISDNNADQEELNSNDDIDKSRSELYRLVGDEYDDTMKILIKKHIDTMNEFKDFYYNNVTSSLCDQLIYLDGISGGNSTDFIFRKLPKTKLLYQQIIEMALSRIIIIDERLWNNNAQLNEMERVYDILKENYSEIGNKSVDFSQKFNENIELQEINNIKYSLYRLKNIEIWNVFYDSDFKVFFFVNLNYRIVGYFDKMGFSFIDDLYEGYDIITMHQGKIDKIRDKMIEFDQSYTYSKVYESIISKFNRTISIVHSGRSKPPEISDKTLFVQFSSLENAFYDSKFSLVNLLYNLK